VGDYERHLSHIPHGERRLFVFLGSTIGNFEELEARRFVARITASMRPGDRFLLGVDLVKETRVLDAAYNDEQGITAAFNKNVLAVINRELRANFDAEQFQHVAFFNAAQSQIEMHLEARRAQRVRIAALELELDFKQGERIRTEISRKFTRQTVSGLLSAGGQELVSWFSSPNEYFALALARPALP
jgi:L-histidine N-alpha-methyltransferase